ncbi:MAG: ATP-binding protein, partial [Candidatus Margulisiibacteriota bacterium]
SRFKQKIIFRNELGKDSDKILCDFEKLLQMIDNLMENAAKFSDPASQIIISIKSSGHYLILSIRDYGIGIPKEERPKVFEAFYQSKTERGGAGLGLFLAKSIVEAHHGSIKLISKPEKGTHIEVKLPKAEI